MKGKYILPAVLILLASILCGCGKAKTPAELARLSYQELLKAAPAIDGNRTELQDAAFDDIQNRELFGSHYDRFALADLNRDGVPELIASTVINFRWVPVSVYTCADGKAVLLKDPLEESANGTFEQRSTAGGAYFTYLCGDNHIHSLWRGSTPVGEMEENHAYVLKGTALEAVDCTAIEGTFFSDIAKPNTPQNIAAMLTD